MRVIGTAGHVDHGKSTLVRRLTGIDPDRLKEEKKREMTIDLGFAWFNLPDGETVGVVDVPGHRDFIENMLAGVGGIDAVILVVAADEGVMPQTREHLAILDLLGINNGLVALTKTDLVDDPDWLTLVEQDIADVISGTALDQARIIRVSGTTGAGMNGLISHLNDLLHRLPDKPGYNQPHLAVDRVFTISGFGTVVTGTLVGGQLAVGQEVELQPSGQRARIRGLQSYQQQIEQAQPGSRVAVNLSGVTKAEVTRGQVLTKPNQIRPTRLIDVRYRHLPDASRPLKHNAEVKFFVGSTEALAHARLLNDDILAPGAEGWLQLRLEKHIAVSQYDRFILRFLSPPETIGGGVVANPHPLRRWRRFQTKIIDDLETRLAGSPAEKVVQAALENEPVKRTKIQAVTGYTDTEMDTALAEAIEQGMLHQLPDGTFIAEATWQKLAKQMLQLVEAFHVDHPLRRGIQREQLRSQLGIKQALLTALIESESVIAIDGSLIHMKDHRVRFTASQEDSIRQLMQAMEATPYTPPSYQEAVAITGEDVLRALIDMDEIVQVQDGVILARQAYTEMVTAILQMIASNGRVSTAEVRDTFNTSRKYAIGLLEYLDSIGVTRREGDYRVRGRRQPQPD